MIFIHLHVFECVNSEGPTMVSCEAEVNRKASCIGGVESEARLT